MKKPRKVREPVQVYLDPPDVRRLESLVERLDATKSEVLRRGLEALEDVVANQRALFDLFARADAEQDAGSPVDYDVVLEHDRAIADYVERQIVEREAELAAARKGGRKRRG